MKSRMGSLTVIAAALLAWTAVTPSFADDGDRLFRTISNPPGQVGSPEPEGEHAFVQYLNFYVPSQASDGTLTPVQYINADGALVKEMTKARPLIAFFLYGPVISFDEPSTSGFPGHGRRDAFAAVSLDDGTTWKRTNLSESADKSSFKTVTAIPDPAVPQPEFEVTSDTPITTSTLYDATKTTLTIAGTDATAKTTVEVRNAITHQVIGTARAKSNGSFELELRKLAETTVPCSVQAGYSLTNVWGPYLHVAGAPDACVGTDQMTMTNDYPGDVTNGVHAMAGNKIIAAWQSKWCTSGFPAWGDSYDRTTVATYLGIDNDPTDGAADFYLTDVFGVAGSQGSVDYREEEEFPGEYDDIGEVPFNCLWTARGVLRENPDLPGTTEVVWFKAERLTSGRRDLNRIEASCVAGAGCAVTWQEDPEGLRPGEGEGAGTGWAGATTNSQTDVWYSFIRWEDFDVVDNAGTFVPLGDLNDATLGTNRPQPAVPMMVAARLTNNARCPADQITGRGDYCEDAFAAPFGIRNQCVTTVNIPLGKDSDPQPVCVVDSNGTGVGDNGDMPNVANTASSRPRLSLQPRDSDGDGLVDDAWVMVFAEEDKGLGRYGFVNDDPWALGNLTDVATACGDPDASKDDNCIEADIGKSVWWFTFAMGTPKTSVASYGGDRAKPAKDVPFSLLNNVLVQGNILNQPEVNWRTGTFFPPMSTANMWNFGDTYNYLIFNTEIARRSSMMAQSLTKAKTGASGLIAFPLWKQGTVNQGGPADIMARRFVIDPATIDPKAQNPYDFNNMKCEYTNDAGSVVAGVKLFTDGTNPMYPKGLCMAPAINLSARTPVACETAGGSLADGICPGQGYTCTEVAGYGQLCKTTDTSDASPENPENIQVFDKLLSWYECPGWNGVDVSVNGGAETLPGACGVEPISATLGSNLNDQSWYMPLEISKGHRGFLDGDFVQMLYAWSPNYKDNAVGRDRYELYVRRSFDGGATWTTTPPNFTASNGVTYSVGQGTTTCETWRDGADSTTDSHVCTAYGAGVAEQSRNVSQLTSNKFTVLDPRFTPTGTNLGVAMPSVPFAGADDWLLFQPEDPTDLRNPTRFFVVYETGDNTTTAVGEAEPLDLNYTRGEAFGDHFTVWSEVDTGLSDPIADCYPSNNHGDTTVAWAAGTGFCNEADGLEAKQDDRSEEASVTATANGDFLYGVWAQFTVDDLGEFLEGDAVFRRIWYLDDYIPACEGCAYKVIGQGQQ